MKTPREILLKRHQAAESKLDAIRREVVGRGRVAIPEIRVADTATLPILIWRELILPSRRLWAGLAACWVTLAIINHSVNGGASIIATKSSPTPEMVLAYRQQERLLAELIGQNEPMIAEPRKRFMPQPRTEGRLEIVTV